MKKAANKDPESPETTSYAYDAMIPSWTKIQTVLNGTDAMRMAERAYLPQHPEESDVAYRERLSRNTLFNLSKITLTSWVGRPFSDPIQFDDMPASVEALHEDIDLEGNDIHVFARNWFEDGIAKAYSHCYVDFPRVDKEAPRTLADDQGLRPYWVHIPPEQLYFAEAEVVDGREVLREVRIMEEVTEREGFSEVIHPQIRRIYMREEMTESEELVSVPVVELYRLKQTRSRKREWVLKETYTFDFDRIPLVTFYSDRSAFMMGNPPLEDLVDLNIAHWQSTSDQRAILTVARFPQLALSGGVDDNHNLTIGPFRWLYSPDNQAKFYYVEHSGKAISAGREDLHDLETQMAEYGAEFLKKRPGNVTATARALDAAEATSALQDITLRFADAMNQALHLTALWLKQDAGGTVTISTDFGPEEISQAELNVLIAARKAKDISREAFLEELQRRGLISDEYDIQADAARIEQEAMDMFGGPLSMEEDEEKEKEDESGEAETD